ncbi:DEAD/DEAH box helicase [Candidatus Woesearchaeota archaeon]|jgi:ERCC4-related helicase|nr:DEAD/DEAH box helicase [Candidatus Woesearchaeota archaeon]
MIKDFKPRLYQETVFATTAEKNCLVVLPTGMGKTQIALMLAAHRLKQYPKSKILIVAPTKPLVEQIMNVFKKYLDVPDEKITMFTGHVKPEKRVELWDSCQVIASTPQSIENDIMGNKIKLEDVSLMVVDEAHRATGEYSYVWLAKQYDKLARYPRILALTASPGSDFEKISEVLMNLFIEEIEVRVDTDPDVRPYVQEVEIVWKQVELTEELKQIQKFLQDCFKTKVKDLKNLGYLDESQMNLQSKLDIIKLQAHLQAELAQGNRDFSVLKSLSVAAEALKVQHAVELLETQGITALKVYLEDIQAQSRTTKTKAVQNLVKDIYFRSALIKTRSLSEQNIEHPKINELKKYLTEKVIILENKNYKAILFSQYRDSCEKIVNLLNEAGISAKLFVGQAHKRQKGLSQKKQIEMLNEFRAGEFQVLVSSSVGEEGLDIPQVDEVIFYEPIPSAIRQIQRRGRTGRQEKGLVTIFLTKDTRDVGYRWSAHHKEKRMYRVLQDVKKNLAFANIKKSNTKLTDYISKNDGIKIYVDHREKGNHVIKELIELGVSIQLEKLDTADYVLGSNVCVEFKSQEDFVDSLLDGRLFQQLKAMKDNFLKPIILVEGSKDLYSIKNIHHNSIRGMLSSIAVDFSIPVIYSKTFRESAALLVAMAKREQEKCGKNFSFHGARKPASFKEQQEYLVSALPGVGPSLAKQLLKKFGSIKKIMGASEEKLKKVEMLGDKKAKQIRDIVGGEY